MFTWNIEVKQLEKGYACLLTINSKKFYATGRGPREAQRKAFTQLRRWRKKKATWR